ncbi:hypothetical protein C0Q70_00687 [Pomacea canaliculata]|uniref:Uncharacterized protein n=1 Tax=Pomacea canaliculata TaxID=400727 RepID=A0A2T7PXC0_POMCA|nr:hypothetical protein C0Q70_00687 [Pomacea canaliculata]
MLVLLSTWLARYSSDPGVRPLNGQQQPSIRTRSRLLDIRVLGSLPTWRSLSLKRREAFRKQRDENPYVRQHGAQRPW